MLTHNHNVTGRRYELEAFVDVINTADAFKLSKLSKYTTRKKRGEKERKLVVFFRATIVTCNQITNFLVQ